MFIKFSPKLKLTTYIFILLIIALVGVNFTVGERVKLNELPSYMIDRILGIIGLNPVRPDEPIQTYELLIKKGPTGVGQGAYQEGDIVMLKPAGYNWSAGELNNFWIVKMDLTPSQAEELVKPKEREIGEKDKDGQPITEIEARRKHYISSELLEQAEQGQALSREVVGER